MKEKAPDRWHTEMRLVMVRVKTKARRESRADKIDYIQRCFFRQATEESRVMADEIWKSYPDNCQNLWGGYYSPSNGGRDEVMGPCSRRGVRKIAGRRVCTQHWKMIYDYLSKPQWD